MTKEKKDNIKNMHNLNKLLQESADLEVVVGALRKTLGYTVSGITLTELVPKVIQLLNSHNIAFAVAGGFARSIYAPYRLTRDIDLSVASNDLKQIDLVLKSNGFSKIDELEYNSPAKREIHKYAYDDKEVDIITYSSDFSKEVIRTAQSGHLLGQVVKVVSPEMLVLQKMLSCRNKDKADIIEIRDAIDLDMDIITMWASRLKMFDRMTIFEEEKE